jgi:hypothetical protein
MGIARSLSIPPFVLSCLLSVVGSGSEVLAQQELSGNVTDESGSAASYHVAVPVTLYFRVENLGNRECMDPLGYPAWRRTARAGARLGW